MYSEAIAYHQQQRNNARRLAAGSINYTQNNDVNFAKGLISIGMKEDAVEFIKTFDKNIEQLPQKEAKQVLSRLSKMFKKAPAEYFDKLKKSTEYLAQKQNKTELETFNYLFKRVLVFAKQNKIDLKRFI